MYIYIERERLKHELRGKKLVRTDKNTYIIIYIRHIYLKLPLIRDFISRVSKVRK